MWDIIKRRIDQWGIDSTWATLGILICIALVWLIGLWLISDKNVRYYYLQTNSTSAGISYQIWADIDWCDDRLAFSSPDPALTMKVFSELPHKP